MLSRIFVTCKRPSLLRSGQCRRGCATEPPKQGGLEVELKFALDPQVRQRIANLPGIRLINQKKFVDTYYDVQGYKLSTSDIWFRNRAKAWEIKIPTTFTSGNHDPNNNSRIDKYAELTDEPAIIEFLERNKYLVGSNARRGIALNITTGVLFPYATLETTRTKFLMDDVTIDLDETDFGYSIGELEIMVTSEDAIQQAEDKIRLFAKQHNLPTPRNLQGKVLTYIYRNNKEQYELLKSSGVLKSKGIEEQ